LNVGRPGFRAAGTRTLQPTDAYKKLQDARIWQDSRIGYRRDSAKWLQFLVENKHPILAPWFQAKDSSR
jgi:hypothetical protein